MPSAADPETTCMELLARHDLAGLLDCAPTSGWGPVWAKFEELYQGHPFRDNAEKGVFTDLYLSCCLASQQMPQDGEALWELIDIWLSRRNLPGRYAALAPGEKAAALFFCRKLREKLREYFRLTSCTDLGRLAERHQQNMLGLWQNVFLNLFSPLHILESGPEQSGDLPASPAEWKKAGYLGLLAASMYFPLDAEDFAIDAEDLFACELPLYAKTVLVRWLINIPYFNGEMRHRDRLVRAVPELCQALRRHPEILTQAYFVNFVQEVMTGFWRASYIGGNNVEALSAFGDFISATINGFAPHLPKSQPRERPAGGRIRIGYISRNFFRQAVSYYMINRILHHDRDKFEVFVFSLGDYKDDWTDLFVANSDHFEKFAELRNFSAIIDSVLKSQLDILVYTDIGMDVVTYILGGLRLAPVQCAMVGHGTTTGLPTIDYYLSGDFEGPTAQSQYREKLIRLPNLGAAQYLPDPPVQSISRAGLGIPDDAVVFVSCANGIKHRQERERLYIEILRRAPNAWVVLKPYTTPDGVDNQLAKRLREAAAAAGVGDRMIILGSIGHYRSVLGLLAISNIQLDTYPYGGWTTNMEALYIGLPIVTQEGELSRSRWGAGMLRAMGISEGIAANEEEFVQWAVRFAEDRGLRQQVASRIKERALEVLFSGPAAQADFEKVLLDLVDGGGECKPTNNENVLKQLGRISVVLPKRIYAATSIAPKDYPGQRAALDSWRQAGFQIIAVNPAAEAEALRQHFPDISFVAAERDARAEYKRPYIYFDDLLAHLSRTKAPIGGIINADIHLVNRGLYDYLMAQSTEAVVFGSRFDTKSLDSKEGKIYNLGFDFFFFSASFLTRFPQESFCLGLPWWDFWAALVPLARNWPLKRLVTPVAVHVAHQAAWDKEAWLHLGNKLASHFPAASPLSPATMLPYLHQCAQKINQDATDVIL